MKNKNIMLIILILISTVSISTICFAYTQNGGLGIEQAAWEKAHFKTKFPEGGGQGFDGKYNVQYTYSDQTFSKKIVESFKKDVSSVDSVTEMKIMINILTPGDKKLIEQYPTSFGNKVFTYYSKKLKENVINCPFQKEEDAGYFTVYLSFGTSKNLKSFSIFLGKNPK